MSTYFVQGSTMDAIADAINAKTGGSSAMTPAQMVTAIGSISGGATTPLLVTHESITITSDRLTVETGGNAKAFSDEFLPALSPSQIGYPAILVLVENTSDSEYAVQSAARLSGVTNGALVTARFGIRTNRTNIDMSDAGTSLYMGAGSVVHRYVFVREEPTI